MRFEFATATRILFGPGTVAEAAPIAASLGQHPLVVTGREPSRAASLLDGLESHSLEPLAFAVAGEPTVGTVAEGTALARAADCDLVIAIGGGSALDAGKAIAMLLANGGEPLDYLEVIGRGQPITRPSLPLVAIPTTAGTGTEVTRNAVLGSPEHGVKVSLRSSLMLPTVAIVDPELTYGLLPAITASTGLDALAQCVEPFVSRKANPLVDAVAREGMVRAARSLRRAYENGGDVVAREDMAVASLMGGLSLANAGLGAVHGFAGPIGGSFRAPHGAICARLLPLVMATNVAALQAREPDSAVLARYDEIARLLTGQPGATVADGVRWVEELVGALHIPSLGTYGVTEADFPQIVANSQRASSMQGNPIRLSDEELAAILYEAL
jgi:alcohol dehydrogenase class IV